MKKPFNNSVKEHLESISLNDKQLKELMAMQEHYIYRPSTKKRRIQMPWYKITGFSALILFGISVAMIMNYLNPIDKTTSATITPTIIQRIANEVATNHLKMKPLEIKAKGVSELENYFSQLSFVPYNAQSLASNNQITLAGGRYCSIQGSKAAQLRYKDKKGDYVTLFETAYSAVLFEKLPNLDNGEAPVVTYTKGIKVSMWVENGIVMVSTEKFR